MLGGQVAKPRCKICTMHIPSMQTFLDRGFQLSLQEPPLKRKSVLLWGSGFQA